MKIVILKNNLKTALESVGKAVGKNSNLPIISNVLLKISDSKIKVISTNLEIGMIFTASGKIIEEGGITVPYDVIYSIISNLSSERINLETKENTLVIKTENYEASIQGVSESEFPIIPKIEEKGGYFEVSQGLFKEVLGKVMIAAGENDLRPEINSVLFVVEPAMLKFAATDSFRLAESKIEGTQFKNKFEEGFKSIIPLKTVQIISKVLSDKDEKIHFYFDQTQILAKLENLEIVSRIVDGKFPDYEAIIPKTIDSEVTLNRMEIINALKLASSFAAKAREVKLSIKDKVMEVSSADNSIGENKYIIPVKLNGPEVNIVFNLKYLMDAVRAEDSEQIYIGLNGDSRPTLTKTPNQASYFQIIMPVKA